MVTEQFIQDALCWPERIQRALRDTGRSDWQFFDTASEDPSQPADVVNQEISFDRGRVDILATFNRRTRLVIIEVKAGIAGLEAVKQLDWYLENWSKMPRDTMQLQVSPQDVVGIVLAEGFVGIPDVRQNVLLVSFKFNGDEWPFRIVEPIDTIPTVLSEEPSLDAGKYSQLYSFADHRDYLRSPQLREAFEAISNFLTDAGDRRREWILRNVKGSHIAVHYKGEYLMHLWSKRNYFYVGYDTVTRERRWFKILEADVETACSEISREVRQLLDDTDLRMAKVIPPNFSWTGKQTNGEP